MTLPAHEVPRRARRVLVYLLQGGLLLTFLLLGLLFEYYAGLMRHTLARLTWAAAVALSGALITALFGAWIAGQRHTYPRPLFIVTFSLVWILALLLLLAGASLTHRLLPLTPELILLLGFMIMTMGGLITVILMSRAYRLNIQAQHRQVLTLAERDSLTGLLNRAGLRRTGEAWVQRQDLIVVLLDINSLKRVNDLGGHDAGDAYLRQIARALDKELPPGAAAGRWSGDEFLLLLPGATDVAPLMERLLALVPHPQGRSRAFAYGAAAAARGVMLDQVLALADQAMYEQKTQLEAQDAVDGVSYAQLQDFTQYLMHLDSAASILDRGLQRCLQITGFEGAAYCRLTAGAEHLEPVAWQPPTAAAASDVWGRQTYASDLTMDAAQERQTRWDVNFGRRHDVAPLTQEYGVRSLVVTPVLTGPGGEHVTGVLFLLTFSIWRSISPQSRLVLETLALHLGLALERERIVERLHTSLENSVRELGIVLEARDLETSGHTDRVTSLAMDFAGTLGLSTEQREHLRLGAYLHDVGKLGIPDRVLLKPGRLNSEERALIETHTVRGAELVRRLPSLPPEVVEVVLSHHERWDGTGYPQGLAGEHIPLLARVFAVCDVYDALTSQRPYKDAWTHEAAIAELSLQAGRQFDPQLVNAFVRWCQEERGGAAWP